MKAYAHMCAFCMKSKDDEGEGPVLKPTIFTTNSTEVKKELSQRCRGCKRHVHLMERRARAAQIDPPMFCRALCRGVIAQAKVDAQDMMSVKCSASSKKAQGMHEDSSIKHEGNDWMKSWDDLSGKPRDWNRTQEARREEVECIHKMGVYEKVPNSAVYRSHRQEAKWDPMG